LRALVGSLGQQFPFSSLLATDVSGTRYEVLKSETSVRDSMWTERGAVVRVHDGAGYAECSFNRWPAPGAGTASAGATVDWDRLRRSIVRRLDRTAAAVRRSGAPVGSFPLPAEEPLRLSWQAEVRTLPGQVSSREKIERLRAMRERAWPVSPYLVNMRVVYEEVQVGKLYLSGARDLEQAYVWTQGYLSPIVRKGERTRYLANSFSGLKGVELLEEMEASVEGAVEEAALLLDAGRVQPGEYDVICSPTVAGLLAHEAFGHGVEMDMFVKNRAKAVEYLGRPVASPLVTMHDGALAASEVASYRFDDEGTPGSDTVVIDRGILRAGISDLLSAQRLGVRPTGNGRRESFERKAYARMTNTFFGPGESTLEQMIGSVRHGYLLEKMFSGMEDPKNWGIQCVLAYGREIRDGRLSGTIVSPVIMTGYVPDVLQSISMVSAPVSLSGSGMCGKGHKEYVKTSIGGPYIKIRARLV
jgi:TldD protein